MRTVVQRTLLPAVVLAGLAAGTTAFAVHDKTVSVTVDGSDQQVHTFARDVRTVLARAGIRVGPHDVVTPALTAAVHDGSQVVVRHGRPLQLTLDGRHRTVWVTARSVDAALDEIGVRQRGAYLSVSRSREVPRGGLALTVRTPQRVTVLVDGRRLTRLTTAPTVFVLMHELGVRFAGGDRLNVSKSTYPTTGMVVEVTRIRPALVTRSVAVPFDTVTRPDDSLYKGDEQVVRDGAPGVRVVTYRYLFRNGKPWKKTVLADRVTQQPVTRIVAVGTKERPQYAPKADGLNWAALAQCESGGDPRAVSYHGTYRGLYQFTMGTWQSVGGTGDPIDASPDEQTYRAQLLYQREGDSPWPVCGHYLYS